MDLLDERLLCVMPPSFAVARIHVRLCPHQTKQVVQLEGQLTTLRRDALAADGHQRQLTQLRQDCEEAAAAVAAAQAETRAVELRLAAVEAAGAAAGTAREEAEAAVRRLARAVEDKEQQRVAATRDAQVPPPRTSELLLVVANPAYCYADISFAPFSGCQSVVCGPTKAARCCRHHHRQLRLVRPSATATTITVAAENAPRGGGRG